ncbi:MAG: hypothetical protein AVDCRST_MAG93-2209 [uncultured Chloroflexia bacterium]|uniref:Uncharacterized protein n=1 Tax=uncultured Chloroflexia bacterium TaxID=1672391 RepID=A0A6J4IWQ5_9CHLR|nr:MAG: hypothetical protein AVDCRST_MAG93-2209 [uncultured Chloroflexia bacterium]
MAHDLLLLHHNQEGSDAITWGEQASPLVARQSRGGAYMTMIPNPIGPGPDISPTPLPTPSPFPEPMPDPITVPDPMPPHPDPVDPQPPVIME